MKFEITNHGNKAETNAIDEAYAHAAKGQTEEQPEEQEEYKDDEQPTVIDLDVAPDKTFSEPVSQENGQAQTDETADAADSLENAAEEQTDAETAGKPLSFLEQQRQLRAARAKQEDEET